MSGPYIIPATGSKYNVFERLGHPGKYYGVKSVNNTTVDFTGSNYGYGAFSLSDVTNVHITASNGALLEGSDFTAKTIYEIGLKRIEIGSSGKAIAYKLKGM